MRAFPHPAFIRNNQQQQFSAGTMGTPKLVPAFLGEPKAPLGNALDHGGVVGVWGRAGAWTRYLRILTRVKGRRSERNEGFIFSNKLMDKTSTER